MNSSNKLNELSRSFIKELSSDPSKIEKLALSIINLMSHETFAKYRFDLVGFSSHEAIVEKWINCFLPMLPILNVEVELNSSDGKTQKMVTSSIALQMLQVLEHDYHKIVGNCQKYKKKDGICDLGNKLINDEDTPNTHLFTCDYHDQDSLATHLVMASVINGFRAMSLGMSDRMIGICQIVALVHDIGKPLTIQTIELEKNLSIGFPCHGEIGRMILLPHWCSEMAKLLSEDEFMAICDTVGRHMCGYHAIGSSNDKTDYKRDLLSYESPLTKVYLSVLRYADTFASLPTDELHKDPTAFVDSHISFMTSINFGSENPKMSFPEFLGKYDFARKVILYLSGTSGSGKGWMANSLQKEFPDTKFVHIERDGCLIESLTGKYDRPTGEIYGKLYAIYDAMKTLMSKRRSILKVLRKGGKVNSRQQSEYDEQEKLVIDRQLGMKDELLPEVIHKVGADPVDITEKIKDILCEKISNAYVDPTIKVIMIDTMMSLFPSGMERNVPLEIKNAFIIHLHIQNLCPRKNGDNVGGSISEQLEVSGPFGPTQPLHPGSMKGRELRLLSSVSTDFSVINGVPKCLHHSSTRPNMVLTVVRTPYGNVGYNHAYTCLKKFLSLSY